MILLQIDQNIVTNGSNRIIEPVNVFKSFLKLVIIFWERKRLQFEVNEYRYRTFLYKQAQKSFKDYFQFLSKFRAGLNTIFLGTATVQTDLPISQWD